MDRPRRRATRSSTGESLEPPPPHALQVGLPEPQAAYETVLHLAFIPARSPGRVQRPRKAQGSHRPAAMADFVKLQIFGTVFEVTT